MYSSPAEDADVYTHVELGFPSKEDRLLVDYAEDETRLTKTVYPYVPVRLVDALMARHGGIVGADMSNVQGGAWDEEA